MPSKAPRTHRRKRNKDRARKWINLGDIEQFEIDDAQAKNARQNEQALIKYELREWRREHGNKPAHRK